MCRATADLNAYQADQETCECRICGVSQSDDQFHNEPVCKTCLELEGQMTGPGKFEDNHGHVTYV